MSDLLETPAPRTGELLGGRYTLVGQLGQGGMARVYRARDELLGRDVAVKLFNAGAAEPADQARRLSETRLLAALSHPSLVTLFDAHVDGSDHAYLVMELIDGPTLRRRIDEEGAIDALDVARMAADLAAALAVVHAAGVVHRDIKPSNVLLRPAGPTDPAAFRATLTDFGIAYLVDSTRVTTPGTLIGTAAYLAPEQARGEAPVPASDIYTLGLLLLESLTGERPFGRGTMHETLMARLTKQPEIPGSVGYEWKSLLTAMTSFDPASRPSAAEVARQASEMAEAPPREEAATATLEGATLPLVSVTALDPDEPTEAMDPPTDEPAPVSVASGTSAANGRAADARPRAAARAERVFVRDARDETPDPIETTATFAGPRTRRLGVRFWILVAIALLVVAAITTTALVLLGASAGAPVPPQLAPVDEPLGSHLQQLLESVTP
ncbi:serine/threonine-protein kinase [Cnuibacter sp. UC19_7]|uniref:serine/threonine-protein kinase n=1 Tax=Cnuibacter sp. UC19_7 TaxID=3350166 RepID=UPI00366A881D